MRTAVDFILDPTNHPVLVFCITGQRKTGCVISCFRKRLQWSLSSILHEYEQVVINMFMWIYTCIYEFMYVCMYVYIYIYVYFFIYIYVYILISIYIYEYEQFTDPEASLSDMIFIENYQWANKSIDNPYQGLVWAELANASNIGSISSLKMYLQYRNNGNHRIPSTSNDYTINWYHRLILAELINTIIENTIYVISADLFLVEKQYGNCRTFLMSRGFDD
jgi:hypothetical protein